MFMRSVLLAVVACVTVSTSAWAAAIVPTYTTFGPLPVATFGGSGIPNDRVAVTTQTLTSGTLTLGLTATERYDNVPVGDNGAGTYYPAPGPDSNTVSPNPAYATYNFDFYVQNTSTADFLTYALLVDFDPASGNDESTHGVLNLSSGVFNSGAGMQNSFNLGMGFLNSDVPGFVTSPLYAAFNPNEAGERSFALIAYNAQGQEIARSAIVVNDGDVSSVPEPATATLALLGLGFAFGARRLRRRA